MTGVQTCALPIYEAAFGTNTKLADSDNDGLLDSIEITALGSTRSIAYGNFAGTYDGSGTDPLAADSDNDGLLDGIEFAIAGSTVLISDGANAGSYTGTGTNPVRADSDGDGLIDGQIGRGQIPRRVGKCAVAANIAAQLGQRNEDLGRVADAAAVHPIPATAGRLHQVIQIVIAGQADRLIAIDDVSVGCQIDDGVDSRSHGR